jgi:hypothetical protein
MKLPCLENLIVEQEKITGYLLNPEHRYGATKARFFIAVGFSVEAWSTLADALREHGRKHHIVASRETGYGPRYAVEGELSTPSGAQAHVRSVWQFDRGSIAPRLITAYPVPRR